MLGSSRRIYLYWVLLFLPTLGVGVGAFYLLNREEGRLLARAGQIEEARRTALRARAQLAAENVELIVSDLESGLLDTLAAAPAENPDPFLRSLEQANPLVRGTFRCDPDGTLLRPLSADSDEEARGFYRRFSRLLRETAAARFRRSVSLDTAFQVPAVGTPAPKPAQSPGSLPQPALARKKESPATPVQNTAALQEASQAAGAGPAKDSSSGAGQPLAARAEQQASVSQPSADKDETVTLSPFQVSSNDSSTQSKAGLRDFSAESAPETSNYAQNVNRARRDVQSLAKLRPEQAQSSAPAGSSQYPSKARSKSASKTVAAKSPAPSSSPSLSSPAPAGSFVSKDSLLDSATRQADSAQGLLPANGNGPQAIVTPSPVLRHEPPSYGIREARKADADRSFAAEAEHKVAPVKESAPARLPAVPDAFSSPSSPERGASLSASKTRTREQTFASVPEQSRKPLSTLSLTDDAGRPLPATAPVERRGWLPFVLEHRLFLLGWVQPAQDAQVRGVEVELTALVSRLGAALPPDLGPGEGLCLRDERGRIFHQAGTLPFLAEGESGNSATHRSPDFLARVPLATVLLPGWTVEAYLLPPSDAAAESSGFLLTGSLLAGTLVVALLSGGFLLLFQARASAREALQKTSFVANVSHELKTPLTTIRLYSDLLEQGRVPSEARRAEYLRTIGRESERLSRLVNNVLDFSRLERGLRALDAIPLDPSAELRRICEVAAPRLAEAGLRLDLILPDTSLGVRADRDALGQILLNLLDNAIKYAATGGELRVTLHRGGQGRVLLSVADRGPGVEAAERERIFLKFHRIDQSLTAEKGGAGLGLSIARQLAHAMQGELRCLPREGGGAVFELSLPEHAPEASK